MFHTCLRDMIWVSSRDLDVENDDHTISNLKTPINGSSPENIANPENDNHLDGEAPIKPYLIRLSTNRYVIRERGFTIHTIHGISLKRMVFQPPP